MTEFAVPGLMPIDSPKFDVTPPFLAFESQSASDTLWEAVSSIGPITFNDYAPTFAAIRATLIFTPQFKPEHKCVIFDSDEGGDGTIAISDADIWYFEVPPQPLPLYPGLWRWKFTVTDTRGVSMKLYQGQILITP
jgi:hypothetical protein